MKTLLNIFAICLLAAGGTFFLQGINILPGSFMTGDPNWAIIGVVMVAAGIILLAWSRRR